MQSMLTCAWCGEEKCVEEFARHAARPSGRQAICRVCDGVRRKPVLRDCVYCGASFVGCRLTCSDVCRWGLRADSYRRNGTQPGVPPADGVLARDRGCRSDGRYRRSVCVGCGQHIDWHLRYPNVGSLKFGSSGRPFHLFCYLRH